MVGDRDTWELAIAVVKKQGDGAAEFARRQWIDARERRNVVEMHIWAEVADAVDALLTAQPQEGERVH